MKKHALRIFAWIMTMCICLTCLVFPDDVKAVCIAGNHSSIQRIDLPDTYEMEYVDENGGYHYGGAAGHLVIRHQKLVCSECEEVIDEDRTSLKDYSEAHDPDENGVCKKCGYVRQIAPACSHDEKKPGSYIRSGDPELDPNDHSQHIIRNYYAVVCSNCGEALEGEMEGEPTYAPHTFNGEGVCTACNYECTHPEESYVERSLGADDPVPFDEEQHSITEYYRIKCGICGKTVTDEQEKVVYEDHVFDNNGTCTECEYTKAPNPEELKLSLSVSSSTVKVGDVIIAIATVTGGSGDVTPYWYVTGNGNIIYDWVAADLDIDIPTAEAGEYAITVTVSDENGTQRTASTTVTAIPPVECEHENTEPVYTDPEYEQIEGDEENHNVYRYYDVVCSDCGETIETHKCDGSELEAHHFDENGTCSDCGYVKAPNPEELKLSLSVSSSTVKVGDVIIAIATVTGGSGDVTPYWYVTGNGNIIYDWVAADLDIDIPTAEAGEYAITVTVSDENGTQRTASTTVTAIPPVECEHENTEPVYTDPVYEQIEGDEENHYVYRYYDVVCSDCGEIIETHKCDGPETEAHHFDENGTCSDCGYVKAAPSDELRAFVEVEQTTALVGDSLAASATATGGDGNYRFGWKITRDDEELYTTDAGIGPKYNYPADVAGTYVFTVIVVDGEGTTVTADGAPIDVIECQHINKKETRLEILGYINLGENGHTIQYIARIECEDCGKVLEERAGLSKDENHDLTNGTCACGELDHKHVYEPVEINRGNYVNNDSSVHNITITYVDRCTICGDISEEKTRFETEEHDFSYRSEEKSGHQGDLGHLRINYCICGAEQKTYVEKENCCKCKGHQWGEKYEQNGRIMANCKRCDTVTVFAKYEAKTTELNLKLPEFDKPVVPIKKIEDWDNRYTLTDAMVIDVLCRKNETWKGIPLREYATTLYKYPSILSSLSVLAQRALNENYDQDQIDDLMEEVVVENFLRSIAEMEVPSYQVIDEVLSVAQYAHDLQKLDIPLENGETATISLGEIVSKGHLSDKINNTISVVIGGTQIICDTIEDVRTTILLKETFIRAEQYINNLEACTTKRSSLYRACERIRERLNRNSAWNAKSTILDAGELFLSLGVDATIKSVWTQSIPMTVSSAEKSLSLYNDVAGFAQESSEAIMAGNYKQAEILRKQAIECLNQQRQFTRTAKIGAAMHTVAGCVMASEGGAFLGHLITPISGAVASEQDQILKLYIVSQEARQALRDAPNDDSQFDAASLFLSAQDKSQYLSFDYLMNVGDSIGFYIVNHLFYGEERPSYHEFEKLMLDQLEYIDDIRTDMQLPTHVRLTRDQVINQLVEKSGQYYQVPVGDDIYMWVYDDPGAGDSMEMSH